MRPFSGCESPEAVKIARDRSLFLSLRATVFYLAKKKKRKTEASNVKEKRSGYNVAGDKLKFGFMSGDHEPGSFCNRKQEDVTIVKLLFHE